MNQFHPILTACLLVASAAQSRGIIFDLKQVSVVFTNLSEATNQATWSEPDKLTVTPDGLGWDGEGAASRGGWIRTKPLALGLTWRPPFAVSVRVTVEPLPREISLNNGQKTTPNGGEVYVRYSPDLKHWSSWQALQTSEPQGDTEKRNPGRHFGGTVRVSYLERAEYSRLLSEYSALDVPWKSDEEATVRWILKREPDFFAKQIPFIGYVEFLFEGGFQGSQRNRSLNGTVSYGMSGLHSPPKDESARKDRASVPWRFRAVEASALESDPAPAPRDVIDATKAPKAEVILRVRRTSSESADKYAWFDVEILKVLKNESGEAFGKELKVAAYSGKPGVPDGESTVYLERYNKIEKKLWMLSGGEAGTGVSHLKTPK